MWETSGKKIFCTHSTGFFLAQHAPQRPFRQTPGRTGGPGANDRTMSPEERKELRENYRKWQNMSPTEKNRIRSHLEWLKGLSPEARELVRKRHRQWQRLSPGEKNNLRRKLENWDNLPSQEKNRIHRMFQ